MSSNKERIEDQNKSNEQQSNQEEIPSAYKMGWGIDPSSWHHSITSKQQATQNKFSTKKVDSFWARVFVYVLIIGCIGYVVGAGFGSRVAHETIVSTVLWIVIMGIAPFILMPVLKKYGFVALLSVSGIVSIMNTGKSYGGLLEILFHPAVGFSFLGATCFAIVGLIIGVIVECIKATSKTK